MCAAEFLNQGNDAEVAHLNNDSVWVLKKNPRGS